MKERGRNFCCDFPNLKLLWQCQRFLFPFFKNHKISPHPKKTWCHWTPNIKLLENSLVTGVIQHLPSQGKMLPLWGSSLPLCTCCHWTENASTICHWIPQSDAAQFRTVVNSYWRSWRIVKLCPLSESEESVKTKHMLNLSEGLLFPTFSKNSCWAYWICDYEHHGFWTFIKLHQSLDILNYPQTSSICHCFNPSTDLNLFKLLAFSLTCSLFRWILQTGKRRICLGYRVNHVFSTLVQLRNK